MNHEDHATPADAVAVGPCAPAIPLNADVLSACRGAGEGLRTGPPEDHFRQLLINRHFTKLPTVNWIFSTVIGVISSLR